MSVFKKISKRYEDRADEDGGIYIFGLYVFSMIAMVGGVAVDMSNLVAQHTKLQMTTDLAAHAALYKRDSEGSEAATTAALAIAENMMPADRFGTVIGAEDIVFGHYDYATQRFTADSNSREAVLVSAARYAENLNAVDTFLMGFAGLDSVDVAAQAVYVTFRPACLREGFVAQDIVDLQSNNGFTNGFCIHSNTHVSLNSNNFFEEGTIVSMPSLDDLDIPRSGFKTNDGLEVALREGRHHIRVLNMIDDIAAGLLDYNSDYMPDYIDDPYVVYHTDRRFDASDFVPGTINYLDCRSTVTLDDSAGAYSDIILYATCDFKLNQGVVFENVVLYSDSTNADSIKSVSGFQIGRDDNCAPGGGAQLISRGGMRFPASLSLYGGQLIALGDIEFAANADGIEGASMISAGRIDGTSNMDMAFCGTGMEQNFEADYFRLAR